eukprot:CAMPEP_0180797576 /NCGR_PEP_ID=MMETSP1038_2-20121128/57452_1 /TAXON_ID=632150 /ORGANISM="Azadinium spinosum, Strain 3D9" /LENGTH=54 /DNA_ID=CAMNT_0022836863 /DNA_START=335 /DNA_END=499 /DNA_ORIENTATION=+
MGHKATPLPDAEAHAHVPFANGLTLGEALETQALGVLEAPRKRRGEVQSHQVSL